MNNTVKKLLSAIFAIATISTAHAELNTNVTTGITSMQTDAGSLISAVWPFVIVITGAVVVFKLFKRFVKSI